MKIKILTLNCFGTPFANDNKARVQKIGKEIISLNPDIIFLQEVILLSNTKIIKNIFEKEGYRIYNNFGSFLNNMGLLFASKFPIIESESIPFLCQGKILSNQISDRILEKGYQRIVLDFNGKQLTVFHSHIISIYNKFSKEEVLSREAQILELEKVISITKGSIILVGDMNMKPSEDIYKKFFLKTNLQDSLSKNDEITFSSNNTHANAMFRNDFDSRLDYICYSNDIYHIKTDVVFTELFEVNNKKQHLSDHFGIESEIEI